jgi:prepilin-type N-terminal cleavage/methylation domain-containing protein
MRKGFTLIELTVSLVIFSIIMLAVYKTFSSGIAAWDKAIRETETAQNGRAFLNTITRDLRETVSPENAKYGIKFTKNTFFKFTGKTDSLDFTRYSRPVTMYWPEVFPRRSDICNITYYTDSGGTDSTPVVYRKAKWYDVALPWKEEEIESFSGISDLKFSYFNSKTSALQDEWDATKSLAMGSSTLGILPSSVVVQINADSPGNKAQVKLLLTALAAIPVCEK